jgi:hypothetical protein
MGKTWLVQASPYDPGAAAETTVYWSTGRTDGGVPVYNSVLWPRRLLTPLNMETTVFTGEFGGAVPTFGNLQVWLDGGDQDALLGYYWDGRDVLVYRGDETAAFGSFDLAFKGAAKAVSWDRSVLQVSLSDYGEAVQKPVQTTLYAGTGGNEGGADLTGKPKPLSFGKPRNLEPVLLNAAYLVYQFHSRAAQAVDAAFDGALPLTFSADYANYAALVAATVAAGGYATCLAEGLVRLGAPPVFVVTLDVQGDNTGGLVTTAGDIIKRIAVDFAGLVSGDIDTAAFTALNTANSAACSLYVSSGETPSSADLFTALMVSVGGFWTFTSARKLTVRQLAFGTSAATITEALCWDVRRAETPPPYWRRRMGCATSWRVQSENEIAGGVDTAGSIAIDVNQQNFATASNGKAFIHGLNLDGGRADTDGQYYFAGAQVTLSRAQFADGSTLKTSQQATGYIVHDIDPVTATFKDLFAGTSGTDLSAHSPDTGTSWSDISGITSKLKLNGNGQAAPTGSGLVTVLYRANNAPSSADMFSEFKLNASPLSAGSIGLITRYQSSTSMYVLQITKDGTSDPRIVLQISRVTGAGTGSSVASFVSIPFVAGMDIRFTSVGSTHSAAGNGGIFSGYIIGGGSVAPDAIVSNYRDGNVAGSWTVSTEKVAVAFCRYSGGSWQYDTGSGWTNFTRKDSHVILGSLERGASSITSAALTGPQRLPADDTKTLITRGAFVRERQRFVTTSDTAVKTRHKLAREAEVASCLDSASDAATENARQFALLDAKWDLYQVTVQRTWFDSKALKLGDTVTLKLAGRLGLTSGKDFIVGGVATGANADETTLTLWG